MARVDVVVVSYNSRDTLRGCVEPLAGDADLHVVVVDNASSDRSLDAVADLPLDRLQLAENGGFAVGCNAGWRTGAAPYVLFLNPDARIDPTAVHALADALDAAPRAGAAAPRIVDREGKLDFSLRRFPRLRSTFSRALFLHRVFPRAAWTDEVIRDSSVYERAGDHEWVSGACMLVRRTALDELDGFDERFFMYCEDKDLCRRLWGAGYAVVYVPDAVSVHAGGESAPRTSLLPTLTDSRIAYARKHSRALPYALHRLGIGLNELSRVVASRGGVAARAGHARSLRVAATGRAERAAARPRADL